jgi:uncharacterized membrane protein YGL010W
MISYFYHCRKVNKNKHATFIFTVLCSVLSCYTNVVCCRCVSDVTSGIAKLLNFINTVKRLADIRDAVWELLSQVYTIY